MTDLDKHITESDWEQTPPAVREFIVKLLKLIEDLESKLNQNSSNSSRPPSSDNIFTGSKPKPKKAKKRKRGAQKGHKGHKKQMLPPTQEQHIRAEQCGCGSTEFVDQGVYSTHQEIELPVIKMEVRHFHLHQEQCTQCGKIHKAVTPKAHCTGYGPRLSALIAEFSGIMGNSRETVQTFCQSVLGIPISIGAIQNVINRATAAVGPHYDRIREQAHTAEVNHADETTWKNDGDLHWIWVLCNSAVALFMIHPNRSKEAFQKLVGAWTGLLVSDNYGVYRKWVGGRQKCLSHLIRTAQALSEMTNPEIARCGRWAKAELQRLVKMAHAPPTKGQWRAFFARLCHLISTYEDRKDKAGTFVRSLNQEIESLWLFLEASGVEPTNNFAERIIRYAVLWRKRSQGTKSELGDRWVERILSLRQTCRLNNKSSFEVLVNAMESYFKEQNPDLSWIGAK